MAEDRLRRIASRVLPSESRVDHFSSRVLSEMSNEAGEVVIASYLVQLVIKNESKVGDSCNFGVSLETTQLGKAR